jgi:hypothetical protein
MNDNLRDEILKQPVPRPGFRDVGDNQGRAGVERSWPAMVCMNLRMEIVNDDKIIEGLRKPAGERATDEPCATGYEAALRMPKSLRERHWWTFPCSRKRLR